MVFWRFGGKGLVSEIINEWHSCFSFSCIAFCHNTTAEKKSLMHFWPTGYHFIKKKNGLLKDISDFDICYIIGKTLSWAKGRPLNFCFLDFKLKNNCAQNPKT